MLLIGSDRNHPAPLCMPEVFILFSVKLTKSKVCKNVEIPVMGKYDWKLSFGGFWFKPSELDTLFPMQDTHCMAFISAN